MPDPFGKINGQKRNSIGVFDGTAWVALTPTQLAALINALIDHGTLLGLADDDHTQYALLAGRSGGQVLIGSTVTGQNLILQANSANGSDAAVRIYSSAAGAIGASLEFYQESASPAVSDFPGIIYVYAKDANGTRTLVGQWYTAIGETTAGAMSSNQQLMMLDDGTQRTLVWAPDQNAHYPADDAHWDLGVASTNRFRNLYLSATVDAGTTINAATGYRIAGAAAQDAYLLGNGTNFVSENAAWSTYTPTVTATVGSITTVSAAGRYKKLGKTLFLSCAITITTNGTGASNIQFDLPNSLTAAAEQAVYGRERQVVGYQVQGRVPSGSGTVGLWKYDNTYPGGDGHVIVMGGTIEVS